MSHRAQFLVQSSSFSASAPLYLLIETRSVGPTSLSLVKHGYLVLSSWSDIRHCLDHANWRASLMWQDLGDKKTTSNWMTRWKFTSCREMDLPPDAQPTSSCSRTFALPTFRLWPVLATMVSSMISYSTWLLTSIISAALHTRKSDASALSTSTPQPKLSSVPLFPRS